MKDENVKTDRVLLEKIVTHVARDQIEEAKIYLEKILEENSDNIMARCYLAYCNLFSLIEENISEILEGNFVGINAQRENIEEIKAIRKADRAAAFAQAERFFTGAKRAVEKNQVPKYLLFRMIAYLIDPFNPEYLIGLGIVFYDITQKKVLPLYFYHQAATLDPEFKLAYSFAADCYDALGDTAKATELRQVSETKKDASLYHRLEVEDLRAYFQEKEKDYFSEEFEFFPNRISAPVDWKID